MPRKAASAASFLRYSWLPLGKAADRIAKVPVLIMPPKTCPAICNPDDEFSGLS
ncbi:MAG: hypothetical protein ACPHW5_00820 [Candidatus Puniceispirillales bacterium]